MSDKINKKVAMSFVVNNRNEAFKCEELIDKVFKMFANVPGVEDTTVYTTQLSEELGDNSPYRVKAVVTLADFLLWLS